MKPVHNAVLFLSFSILIICVGCKSPEIPNIIQGGNFADLLRYDGPNVNAPLLPQGKYEAAARFLAKDLNTMADYKLTEVQFYIAQLPDSCTVNIYKGTVLEEPGELIYTKNVINTLDANDWHIHELDEDIPLFNDDIWLAISFHHNNAKGSLGCDLGRAEENGDWLYDAYDDLWTPLKLRTQGQIDINWNIRGRIEKD